MAWPTALDYRDAIQNPNICFDDIELKKGTPVTDKMGLPKPDSGAFASVYRIKHGRNDWAVKCFLRELSDQQQRYIAISQHLSANKLPYIVGFEYLKLGIKIHGQWYPIVKMEWVQGESLNNYIRQNIRNPSILLHLANRWIEMIKALQHAHIAHGDLQHGNILVSNGDFRLIDYDGMYVPTLSGKPSHELGHRNYQHPLRSEHDFDEYIDNFSTWVIYTSLIALSIDPNLWDRVDAGEENLLFRKEDFEQPESSVIMSLLRQNPDKSIQSLFSVMKSIIYTDLLNIPSLGNMKAIQPSSISVSNSTLPEWVKPYINSTNNKQPHNTSIEQEETDLSWLLDNIESESILHIQSSSCLPEYIAISVTVTCIASALIIHTIGILSLYSICGIGGEIAVFSMFLLRRYRRLPEVIKKRTVLKNKENVQKDIRQNTEKIKFLCNKKEKIYEDEEKRLNEVMEMQRKCTQSEKDEISIVDKELYSNLAQLNTQLRDIDNSEVNELASALVDFQNQFIYSKLQSYDIARARIPGIGDAMKSRLTCAGVKTAGDIINVHIFNSWRSGYSNEVTYIEIVGRGKIHIDGIGPAKANAILSWKKGLETKMRSNMPQKLDQMRINSIKYKYQSQKSAIEQQITILKQGSDYKKTKIRQKFSKELDSLNRNIIDIKNQSLKSCQDIDRTIDESRKILSSKNWTLAKYQKELSCYKNINFIKYLKHIVSSLKHK